MRLRIAIASRLQIAFSQQCVWHVPHLLWSRMIGYFHWTRKLVSFNFQHSRSVYSLFRLTNNKHSVRHMRLTKMCWNLEKTRHIETHLAKSHSVPWAMRFSCCPFSFSMWTRSIWASEQHSSAKEIPSGFCKRKWQVENYKWLRGRIIAHRKWSNKRNMSEPLFM